MAVKRFFKKGFFFSLDAFFAVMIFTLILVSIYGYFISTQELRQQYFFSEDLFNVFTNTKMEELDFYDAFKEEIRIRYPIHVTLLENKLTIMEQIITLNNNATEQSPEGNEIAVELIIRLTEIYDESERYGFTFNVEDLIYGDEGEEQASALVARQRFVSVTKKITDE